VTAKDTTVNADGREHHAVRVCVVLVVDAHAADDFPTKQPQVVAMMHDSLVGKSFVDEALNEGSKDTNNVSSVWDIFVGPHPTFGPLEEAWAYVLDRFHFFQANVAFSRGAGWRGMCPAQPVTDRTVGYNAWFDSFFVAEFCALLPVSGITLRSEAATILCHTLGQFSRCLSSGTSL